MKIVTLNIIIFSLLLPNARETLADTGSRATLSPAQPTILEAVESIQIPNEGISDPSGTLSHVAKSNLADKLNQYSSYLAVMDSGRTVAERMTRYGHTGIDVKANSQTDADCDNSGFPIQIAVAIVEELGILDDGNDDQSDGLVEEIAGQFATSLHNRWGIGYEIPNNIDGGRDHNSGGGTGVLVFLSVRDRVVFISVGGALRHILTNRRIDRIIRNDMRPDLKRADYEQGLMNGIDAIAELLEIGKEPSVFEPIWDWFSINAIVLSWLSFVVGYSGFERWKRQREQRIYAKAATRLSELDLARAEALRGTYRPATNCPVCLEDFKSEKVGSDGQPIQLLRCGHVFDKTCYQEWVSSGRGDVTKCPMCRADVGSSSSGLPVTPITDENARTNSLARNGAFEDENEQNGGGRSGTSIIGDHDNGNFVSEDENGNESNDSVDNSINNDHSAMSLYQQDRNFRLERLSQLYPRYISIDHVTRWSSPTFNGSLARDPSFRNNEPAVVREASRRHSSRSGHEKGFGGENNGGGGYAFGGGTSAGGRGGRF